MNQKNKAELNNKEVVQTVSEPVTDNKQTVTSGKCLLHAIRHTLLCMSGCIKSLGN